MSNARKSQQVSRALEANPQKNKKAAPNPTQKRIKPPRIRTKIQQIPTKFPQIRAKTH